MLFVLFVAGASLANGYSDTDVTARLTRANQLREKGAFAEAAAMYRTLVEETRAQPIGRQPHNRHSRSRKMPMMAK